MQKFKAQYEQLQKEKARIQAELDDLLEQSKPTDERREGSPFGKREEGASEVFELEKRLALEERLSAILRQINHTLEKIEAGTYDICDKCGNPIEPARLEALPYASLCLACKASLSKNSRGRTR